MNNKDIKQESESFTAYLDKLISRYKQKVTYGVVFNLNENEYPLELLKVINLIKDKVQKWGNNNLFTYSGNLFRTRKIVIIGAESIIHAIDLVILVYLTEISKTDNYDGLQELNVNFEEYLKVEIEKNLTPGYPYNLEIENQIITHINKIINEKHEFNSDT